MPEQIHSLGERVSNEGNFLAARYVEAWGIVSGMATTRSNDQKYGQEKKRRSKNSHEVSEVFKWMP
jgi:hypothetical protein